MARLPAAARSTFSAPSPGARVPGRNLGDLMIKVEARTRDSVTGRVLDANGKVQISDFAPNGVATINTASIDQISTFYINREKFPDPAARRAEAERQIASRPDLMNLKGLIVRPDAPAGIVRAEDCKLMPTRQGEPAQIVAKWAHTAVADSSKLMLQRADTHFRMLGGNLSAIMVAAHDLRPVTMERLEELGQVSSIDLDGSHRERDSYRGLLTVISEADEANPHTIAEISWLPNDPAQKGAQVIGADAYLSKALRERDYRTTAVLLGSLKEEMKFPKDFPAEMREVAEELWAGAAAGDYKVGIAMAQASKVEHFYREALEAGPKQNLKSPIHKFIQGGYMSGVASLSVSNPQADAQGKNESRWMTSLRSFFPDKHPPAPLAAPSQDQKNEAVEPSRRSGPRSLETVAVEAMALAEDKGFVFNEPAGTQKQAAAVQQSSAPRPEPSPPARDDFGPDMDF